MNESIKMRPYQIEATDAILNEWRNGNKNTLLVLPTGCGKTICFADILKKSVSDKKKALVLAHRGELLDQAADKIKKVTGMDCAYEKAAQTALGSELPITVGSVQSLSQDHRLEKFDPDYYSTIVVDEAHHCLADTYKKVLNHFKSANVLGVTATPDRGDKRNLGTFFDSQAYEYTLRQAIEEKYLCPIKAKLIPLKIDISDVSVNNGDFSAGEIDEAIYVYLDEIAKIIANEYKDRKILIFLPLIRTSQTMRDLLVKYGVAAAEVNGQSKDRKEILEDFENNKYTVLCNSMLLTEGWDCPSVDCVIVLRPTKIRSLYSQMIGRGTRLFPGKKELLLLDFLWLTTRHDLCHPSSLIATTEEEAKYMDRCINRNVDGIDLLSANAIAIQEATEERERALAKVLERTKHRTAKLVDPIQYFASIQAYDLLSYSPVFRWETTSPTDKQIEAIRNFGINSEGIKTKGEATLLLDKIINRAKQNMATPKQIRCLENFGFVHVGNWKFIDASEVIDIISKNRWKVPLDIVPSIYNPNNKQNKRGF